MSIDALVNAPIHLLTIGAKKFHVKGLPFGEAPSWSEVAEERAKDLEDADSPEAGALAMASLAEFLEQYPLITEGHRKEVEAGDFNEASTDQLERALEGLRRLNCPLFRKQQQREAANERGLEMMRLTPESERGALLAKGLAMTSASSE